VLPVILNGEDFFALFLSNPASAPCNVMEIRIGFSVIHGEPGGYWVGIASERLAVETVTVLGPTTIGVSVWVISLCISIKFSIYVRCID
jgi:hypothetical protein